MAPADVELDLARLVVRHRHVAPMLSALLTGTNAGVRISDAAGAVILEREGAGIGFERFPIAVEGRTVGWVEGDRTGRAIAAALSYAVARETDKRSLAREALDRYRELHLVYDLAERLSGELELAAVARTVLDEASRLPSGGSAFLLIADEGGRLLPFEPGGAGDDAGDGSGRPGVGAGVGGVFDLVEAGVGIIGAVASSASAEEVNNLAADPRASAAERAFASLIAAPVVARGITIGVLGTASPIAVDYQARDLKLLSAIAAIAGPALAAARAQEAAAVRVG